jgi:serine/threonine-protein kinase RsbW
MSVGATRARDADDDPHATMRVEHPGVLDSVPLLLAFVDEACAQYLLDAESAFAIRLAVDEVCVNLVRHGYPPGPAGPIGLTLAREADRVVVTVTDRGRPFDPASAPVPDLSLLADQRPIGGLGWHLVKHMIDHIEYRSDPDGTNRLTLVKRLPRGGG